MAFLAPLGAALAPFAAPLAVAGSLAGAAGTLMAGQQAASVGKYNAAVDQQRAQIATDQSQAQAAIDEANNTRRQGAATAAYGASGVALTGTPLEVMTDLATQGELTKRLDIYKGNLTATADQQQAALDSAQGASAQIGSYFGAGSTLLTGALNAARNAYTPSGPGTSPAAKGP